MTKLYIVILFNLYAEYIMRNSRMDEWEGGIKYARNINSPQICKSHHPDGWMQRGTQEPFILMMVKEESEWQSLLETQHSKN